MLREKWDQAQRLFLAAADLAQSERALFLSKSCADDQEPRDEVESLIHSDTGSAEYIAAAVVDEAVRLLDSQFRDDRLGPYRILRQLGRGGMGAVFLATRDDDQYQKQVAIKVVKRGMDTDEVLERFRYERQILANLDHPFIARLYDGGTTLDGLPYFVMEFVEGQPVDAFCRQHELDTKARLRLFLRICEAVAYAHRNLVVHRDLKPGNIFVTASGMPKLLDFGIAKLVSATPSRTTTMAQAFTPDYASPEQVRGEPISTATDVYALGAVLFELLTGERAQKVNTVTPLEVDRAVCQTEVRRPSLVARNLDTELDNIVLMAMRKEPERRYPSADRFAADIQRYLDGEPVMARQNSVPYRAGKFIRRHRWEVAAACVVAASLIGATVVSGLQYRRAQAERMVAVGERGRAEAESRQAAEARQAEAHARAIADEQRIVADQQRDEAQVQRARAEQRVTDLIDLANKTLFDVNDAVESLPGALAARQMIVKTTLGYLQRLEKNVRGDTRIRLVLSEAYLRIGLIQGGTKSASLHDFEGGRVSFLKAEALLAPIYSAHPDDPDLILRWLNVEDALADVAYRLGKNQAAVETYQKLLPVSHWLGKMRPDDVESAKQESLIQSNMATILLNTDPTRGLEHAKLGIALMPGLIARFPRDKRLKEEFAIGLASAASASGAAGELDQSAESYRQSIEIREDLLRDDPHNVSLQRGLIVANGNYARVLGVPWSENLGRFAEARVAGARAVSIARAMVAADPQDANARFDLAMSLSRLGSIDPESGGAADSLAILREAIALMEPVLKSNPKTLAIAAQLAVAYQFAGHRLESLARPREAAQQYQACLAATALFDNEHAAAQAIRAEQDLAVLYASTGDRTRAFDYAHRALATAEPYAAAQNEDRRTAHWARSYFVLASVQSTFGEWVDARQNAQRALELWRLVHRPGILALDQKSIAAAGELVKKAEAVQAIQ